MPDAHGRGQYWDNSTYKGWADGHGLANNWPNSPAPFPDAGGRDWADPNTHFYESNWGAGVPKQSLGGTSISGTPKVGQTLTIINNVASWDGNPTSFIYQWKKGSTGNEFASFNADIIPGATGPIYVPVAADVGSYISAYVIGVNASGTSIPYFGHVGNTVSQVTGSGVPVITALPVKVSENHRYFVDQNGTPVFWLGTTQWNLFRDYRLEEARTTLEKTKSHGFTFAQVMLLGVGDGTKANVYGEKPWTTLDPLTPNEAYFKRVDAVLGIARENNVVISLTLYHQQWRKIITEKNARTWGKWLAQRYKDVSNIVWSMTPEARQEFVPVLGELAGGLQEGDGGAHLITFKPDPAPFSSSFIQEEKWLDFDSMQTGNRVELIYPFVTKDYNLKPVKPVLMAEGAYEHGSEYGFEVSPLWVRRQAYYSYLAGAHHTYGHNDSWRVLPTWKESLDAPGAVQMGILRTVFEARKEWWNLVPDQTILTSGGKTDGTVLNLAARHKDGKWLMVYLAGKATITVDRGKFTGGQKASAFWIDPRTGKSVSIGMVPSKGVGEFTTPEAWEDALLILE